MPNSVPYNFADALTIIWHPEYANALVLIAVLLFILVHARAEGWGILKHSCVFLLLAMLSAFASSVSYFLGMLLPARILDEVAIIIVGLLTIRLFGLSLFRVFLPSIRLTPPRILEDIILVLAYVAWGMVRMSQAGVNLSGLVTTSAVITGIIAFSMQDTLGNILGGLALQLDNSVSIGNWIKVDDISGQVIEVHWRHTAVRTRNGEIIVIPNSLLMKAKVTIVGSEDVTQWRRWIYFSLSNSIPPQRVIDGLRKSLTRSGNSPSQ